MRECGYRKINERIHLIERTVKKLRSKRIGNIFKIHHAEIRHSVEIMHRTDYKFIRMAAKKSFRYFGILLGLTELYAENKIKRAAIFFLCRTHRLPCTVAVIACVYLFRLAVYIAVVGYRKVGKPQLYRAHAKRIDARIFPAVMRKDGMCMHITRNIFHISNLGFCRYCSFYLISGFT